MDATDPPNTQASPLINEHKLEIFRILGVAEYQELLGDVMREVPAKLSLIRAAISGEDAQQIKVHAHALRGILGYFGCVAMSERLNQLENQESVMPGDADGICEDIQTLWDKSLAAIRQWESAAPNFLP